MSSVTIDDGIRDDGPMMKTMFAYSDGQKDRHEREFPRIWKVVTKNIDTEQGESAGLSSGCATLRCVYLLRKGNELECLWRMPRQQNTPRHAMNMYYLTAKVTAYTFTKQKKLCSDRASAYSITATTANKRYEGQATGITTSEAWNEYYLTGYHGAEVLQVQ